MVTSRSYSKGCETRNYSRHSSRLFPISTWELSLLSYPSIPTHPNPIIPTPPHPNIPPHSIYLFSYWNASPISSPYGVTYHLYTSSLGKLHRPQVSIIPSSMPPNLIPPNFCPCYSRRMSEHSRKRKNKCSTLIKKNRSDSSISRED